jgi:hypothetical protein
MIPRFEKSGNLPPGVHLATWDEFAARFGTTAHRQRLIRGLASALDSLRFAGCKRVYVDGSFVTAKEVPADFDVAWDSAGVDLALLQGAEPVLFDFNNLRARQKARFGGEFFPSSVGVNPAGTTFLEFFQADKNTGDPKGIVALDL